MADEDRSHTTAEDPSYPDFRWSRKKRRLCLAYVESEGDMEVARKEAGYSERFNLLEILDHPAARDYMASLVQYGLSAASEARPTIIGRYSEWASCDAAEFFTDDPTPSFKGLSELTPAQRRCIKSIKVSRNQFGDNIEIAFEDRMTANTHLARLMGLDKDSGITPEAFARSVQEFVKMIFAADAIEAPAGAADPFGEPAAPPGPQVVAVVTPVKPPSPSPRLWGDHPSPLDAGP